MTVPWSTWAATGDVPSDVLGRESYHVRSEISLTAIAFNNCLEMVPPMAKIPRLNMNAKETSNPRARQYR